MLSLSPEPLFDYSMGEVAVKSAVYTVWCRYNVVNFLENLHKIHPIARPLAVSFKSDSCSAAVITVLCVVLG